MNPTGFQHIFSDRFDTGLFDIAYFDLSNTGSTLLPSVYPGRIIYSGGINGNIEEFYALSDYGLISGNNYLSIKNFDNFNINDGFTFVGISLQISSGGYKIINNLESGVINGQLVYSGFNFGINAAGRLYFQSHDDMSFYTKTSSYILPELINFCLIYNSPNISFGYYDPLEKKLNIENFEINPNFLLKNDNLYIGSGQLFMLNRLAIFGIPINIDDLSFLCDGFYCNYSGNSIIEVDNLVEVTGHVVDNITFFSGITGYQSIATGVILDEFGNSFTGYYYSGITGILTGSGIIPLTGEVSYSVTDEQEPVKIYNTGFIQNFFYKNLNLLRLIDLNDIVEIYSLNTNTGFNISPTIDILDNTIDKSNANNYTLFINGINIFSGSYISGNLIYDNYLDMISGGYVEQNSKLFLSGVKLESSDIVILDEGISGFGLFNYTGANLLNLNGLDSLQNPIVFLNGVKLLSGINYTFSGDNLVFNNVDATGHIFIYEINHAYLDQETGILNYNGVYNNVGKGNTMVFVNGIRQALNQDFILNNPYDYLNNSGLFFSKTQTIYNNNSLFFE